MLVGPVFSREAVVVPRRVRHYMMRTVYAVALLLLICTAWMILAGTQIIQNVGDMARFGSVLFQILAPLQLALIMFLAAMQAASNIAIEKDRQTLILLLMSRLTNSELVLGKLFASLLSIGVMLITSLPIFMLIVLFGGTSFEQVGWTFAVTAVTAFAAGSLGALIALWREKTFQTLALVGISIVFWLGLWEGMGLSGIESVRLDRGADRRRDQPDSRDYRRQPTNRQFDLARCRSSLSGWSQHRSAVCCVVIGILKVRRWNPSRDVRIGQIGRRGNEPH